MEIGGVDTIFHLGTSEKGFVVAVEYLLAQWPKAIVENSNGHVVATPIKDHRELFVYRNEAARERWSNPEDTAVDQDMVQFIRDDEDLTVVTGDTTFPETAALIEALHRLLELR